MRPSADAPPPGERQLWSQSNELNSSFRFFSPTSVTVEVDSDDDGLADSADNCVAVANADQRDTDTDGIGNLCDADLNQDCVVQFEDLGLLRTVFFTADANADFNGDGIGSSQWMQVTWAANPATKPGAVGTMFSGTSSSGGAGSIVARKERAAGTAYVVIYVEQHSKNYVGTLIDIVEVEAAETGLVVVDAEAMGSDIDEYGRVVLDGIVFDFDKATLKSESAKNRAARSEAPG